MAKPREPIAEREMLRGNFALNNNVILLVPKIVV